MTLQISGRKKNTFYRALYRYKMNGYKGTRVSSFYSGFFYVDYNIYIYVYMYIPSGLAA